jgi:hypothetical protein
MVAAVMRKSTINLERTSAARFSVVEAIRGGSSGTDLLANGSLTARLALPSQGSLTCRGILVTGYRRPPAVPSHAGAATFTGPQINRK